MNLGQIFDRKSFSYSNLIVNQNTLEIFFFFLEINHNLNQIELLPTKVLLNSGQFKVQFEKGNIVKVSNPSLK